MIELGKISIKDKASILNARNKIRILAEDLKFDSITATRLATMTSELSRRMVTADQASNIEVRLNKRGGALSLVLLFSSGKTMPALDIKTLEAVFDDVDEFQTMDRLESIRTFKFLPDPELELTEEFIGKERELVQRLTREELYLQLRDAHEELVRKEKLAVLGHLAGGVAHELRNPLGVISNAIYYLKTILSDLDETTREYLDIITSEVRKSEKIVSDLLGFSRTMPAEREKIALSELVDQALKKQPSPDNVKVTKEIASDLPLVFIDPRPIGRVLFNLITNAYQAMTEGGTLTIRAQSKKDKISLSITDTGCGISKENMNKIFEPLFTTRARGIGLGLAVSNNLVEVSGGSIEVESTEGKGSTFTIILPVS